MRRSPSPPSEHVSHIMHARVWPSIVSSRAVDEIVVPAIFVPEVVAALARRGHDSGAAERFAVALIATQANVVTIGPRRGPLQSRAFAARHRLRVRPMPATHVGRGTA